VFIVPVKELMPIIIPGMLIQLLVQIYYINACWKNNRLSQRKKGIYIAVIALFHLLGAAVYLFTTRDDEAENAGTDEYSDSSSQTAQGIFVLLLIIFEIFFLRAYIFSRQPAFPQQFPGLILGICFTAMIVDGLLLNHLTGRSLRNGRTGWISTYFYDYFFALIQIVSILIALRIDRGQNVQFLALTVLAAIINRHSLKRGAVFSALFFTAYIVISVLNIIDLYGKFSGDEGISSLYVQILSFLIIFVVFYSLKWQFKVNRQLAAALETLRSQSGQLEEMSAAAERSRVVGQIHDTVGHTLTTAVISVEAGEKLLDQNKEEAAKKFLLAGKQVRIALQELRNSVRTIQSGVQLPFISELSQLLDQIKEDTGLIINLIADDDTEILPLQQSVLLRAVRECISSSLKHGRSGQIDILVQLTSGMLQLAISDDGRGSTDPVWGFGLQNMNKQIEGLGGTMIIESQPDEGFTVNIAIPVSMPAKGGPDE
jgi:signal transduction histidine kinase